MIASVNKTQKLDVLVGSVEDLLARLPEGLDPRITELRDKVDEGIFEAWKSISAERLHVERALRRMRPLTLGAAVGLAVLLAFSARLLLDRMRR
jgi:hypothetical protein